MGENKNRQTRYFLLIILKRFGSFSQDFSQLFLKVFRMLVQMKALFPPPPPNSRQLQLISVTSGFTRTKYVCRGLISLYVNFYNNRTMWSTNLHVKICRWGKRKKSPNEQMTAGLFFFCSTFNGLQRLHWGIFLLFSSCPIDFLKECPNNFVML